MSADVGMRNNGQAVSAAVHRAQREARDREAAAEDADVRTAGEPTPLGTPTVNIGTGTTTARP